MADTIRGVGAVTERDEPARGIDVLTTTALRAWRQARLVPPEVVVFVVALAARFGVLLRDGGLRGANGYDASVYFAASDSLIHGRLPYVDFVFLHPPGLPLFLTPFAALTKIMSDESAFVVACVCFAVVGALNAALVTRLAKRLGFAARPALIGGLFYATWFGAVGSEYLTKLEPLGNFVFLGAVLAALAAGRAATPAGMRWRFILAGVALGFVLSVKIWWIVPVLGVLVWQAWGLRNVRAVRYMLTGMLATAVVVDLPFLLASRGAMWSSVIEDQLGRQRNRDGIAVRIGDLTTLPRLGHYLSGVELVGAGLMLSVLFCFVLQRAWRSRVARPMVVLALVQVGVVLVAPSWFPYYCDYLAVAFALVVAGAATSSGHPRARLAGWAPTAAAASVTAAALLLATSVERPFGGAATLTRAVASYRCVMTDNPVAQIQLDALSRGLAAGCPNWVDVSGPTYGPYRSPAGVSRLDNTRWQHAFADYLRSGAAVIIVRRGALAPATRAAVTRDGVLARAGGHTVYRVSR